MPNGAIAGVDDATWALADRLTAPTYTADTTAAMQAALARAGVATFSDSSSLTPEAPLTAVTSPFQLLDFQAHALAVGAWAGTAWSGAQLDGVVALPDGSTGLAPTSAVLAGYVAAVDTPGAALARALMAGQDLLKPSTLQFPGVVLVLFAADLATDGGSTPAPGVSPSPAALDGGRLLALAETGPNAPRLADAPAVAGGPCSNVADWIQGMITRLFDSLKVAAQSNIVLAVFAAIWNWIVDKLHDFVEGIITSVTDLVFGYVQRIAATIAAISEQIASILPYAVKVTATGPDGNLFDLATAEGSMQGAFVVAVRAGDLPDWPDVLKDCAQVAGIALPDFRSKNVPLTWGPLDVLAPHDPLLAPVPVSPTNGVTDASGQAVWSFQTAANPGDPTGPLKFQQDIMHVAVHRPELDQIRAALTNALLSFVPKILRAFVAGLITQIAPNLDGIQNSVNALLDVPGKGTAVIEYRDKVPPTPAPPSATPAPSSACTVALPAGAYQGTFSFNSTENIPPGVIDLGESGIDNDQGTGPVNANVAADGSVTGTAQMSLQMHDQYLGLAVGTMDQTIEEQGVVGGTLCSLSLSLTSETSVSCQATGYGSCGAVGGTVSLTGLVPTLPFGPPSSVTSSALTWSVSSDTNADAGFGGLSADIKSTTTVTLATH